MARQYDTPFHGELSSADASTPAAITLYGPRSVAPVTVGPNDFVIITDILIVAGADLVVTLFDGADTTPDAGEVIAKGSFPENGGASCSLQTPHICQTGTTVKVKAGGAGQVDVTIRGKVVQYAS